MLSSTTPFQTEVMYNVCMMAVSSLHLSHFHIEKHSGCFHFPTHLVTLEIHEQLVYNWDLYSVMINDGGTDHIVTELVPMPSRGKFSTVFGWLVCLMNAKGQEGAHHAGLKMSTAKRE